MLGNLAAPVFSLATGPILARSLAPEGRGVLAVSMAAMMFAPALLSGGLPAALLHFGARAQLTRRLLRQVLATALALSLLGTCLVLVYASRMDQIYQDSLWLVAAAVVVMLPLDCARGLLQASRSFGNASLEAWISNGLRFSGVVTLAAVHELTPVTATAVVLLSSVLATARWLPAIRSLARRAVSTTPDAITGRPFARYAAGSWIAQLASVSNVGVDQIVLGFMAASSDIGVYAVAVTWAQLPLFVVSASQRVAIVRAGTDWDDVFVARLTRLTIAAGAVVALGLAVVAPVAIPLLFGHGYEPAVRLSYLLQPGLLFGYGGYMYGSLLATRRRPGDQSWAESAGLVVTVGGLAALVPVMGIEGAAVTSTFSYVVTTSVLLRLLRRDGFREPAVLVTPDDLRWLVDRVRGRSEGGTGALR